MFVGNGSDEILALAFLAFFTDGRPLRHPDPSYSFYPVYCGLYGIEARPVPLDEDFGIDLGPLLVDEGGVVFPNPNAPSSLALALADVRAVLAANRSSVVLVDEAYADFGAPSAVPLVGEHPNLLVSQTFSKGRSLAGMRLGVAFGDATLIEALRTREGLVQLVPGRRRRVGRRRRRDRGRRLAPRARRTARGDPRGLHRRAARARGWRVLDSAANFVFARPPGGDGRAVFESLSAADVLVRRWSVPRLEQWLRISVGTDADMDRLLAVLDGAGAGPLA